MAAKAKIAIIYYSTYGHITKMTDAVVEGVRETGAHADVYQIPETLSKEILEKQYAIPRPDIPEITGALMTQYDGFIFGFPTRYGRAPAQVSAFFDSTGKQWAGGELVGKFATVFTSTASQHGGLETTQFTTMPFFFHHGISYVPTGFASSELTKLDEIIGGSAYGAGTVAGGDGSRQPTATDLKVAKAQGTHFGKTLNIFAAGKAAIARLESGAQQSTVVAESVPASAMAPVASESQPAKEGYAVDNTAATPAAAATTAAPVASAPVTETAQPAAVTQTEKPVAQTAAKEKKPSIFARCCGSSSDYSK